MNAINFIQQQLRLKQLVNQYYQKEGAKLDDESIF